MLHAFQNVLSNVHKTIKLNIENKKIKTEKIYKNPQELLLLGIFLRREDIFLVQVVDFDNG